MRLIEFKDFEIPQKSDEELFGNRLQNGRKTQEKIDTYNEKYGSRFNKDGQLRFSAPVKRSTMSLHLSGKTSASEVRIKTP